MIQLLTENQKRVKVALEHHYGLMARLDASQACEKRASIAEEYYRNLRQIESRAGIMEKEISFDKRALDEFRKNTFIKEYKFMIESDDVSKTEKDYAWKKLQELIK